ncbi:MAG: DUF4065 domain-containing protein [Muribaculaceae bacterium]|nr:DUF4065 domain-containing protein [Muribaculaceae bacterium]
MAYKVLDIANKLLSHAANSGEGELMSNMKLQKMLYYQQGFHIAYFDTPLFEENIEAWMYGPVVPDVYEYFKGSGSNGLEPFEDEIPLADVEEALFNEVFRVYGAFSASGLMNMTHKEYPWLSTSTGVGNIISLDKLKQFFKTRLQ